MAVASAIELPPLALSPAGVPYGPDVDEYIAAQRERVHRQLGALQGDPVEQIVGFARSHHADLIAAGRQGHGLLELPIVGRVTTSLLRAAECAVLVTAAPSLAERDTLQRALTGTSESRAPED